MEFLFLAFNISPFKYDSMEQNQRLISYSSQTVKQMGGGGEISEIFGILYIKFHNIFFFSHTSK